ncbi:MAG: CCA tRNA nucleotidyltransferase [Synechococcaceae cyanobacterium]|nr:CCA tRNA nucleotidyltransferase [Synechococcaceae cyanobacterium]
MAPDPERQARQLWQRLAPQRWPLPPAALPPGSALVGGAVRDGLLDRLGPHPDLDLVVPGDAVALARQLRRRFGGSCVVLDAERSIARLVIEGWTIDLARCAGDDLSSDLQRRDYSINALALPLAGDAPLLDPGGGLADLAAGRLRALAEANLLDDPLRLLRGLRLACELGFTIEPLTLSWIETHHQRLGVVAGERVLAELERLAAAPAGDRGLSATLRAGLLAPWAGSGASPAALACLDGLDAGGARKRGLDAAEIATALPLARLAAVLSGEALARLHASRRLQQQVSRLRRWRERLAPPAAPATKATTARTAAASGPALEALPEAERLALQRDLEADLPALLLHLDAAGARAALQRWRDPDDPLFHPRPPLDGRRLQSELGLPAGPELGALLAHLSRERAFGRLPQSGAAAESDGLACARAWLAQRAVTAAAERRHD